jgi:uncharacterized protein YjiS (DUF1127 family)
MTFALKQNALHPAAGLTPARVLEAVQMVVRGVRAWWKNRRGLAALARIDERLLADIGLTRSDVLGALAEPFWRDPTQAMAQRNACRARRLRVRVVDSAG